MCCKNCLLHLTRKEQVVCRGYLPAEVLFVGEAPGPLENLTGEPFVSLAGHFLDHIIAGCHELTSFTYCLTNVIQCLPKSKTGGIRKPHNAEIEACKGNFEKLFIECSPSVVVTLGDVAKEYMRDSKLWTTAVELIHPARIASRTVEDRVPLLLSSISKIITAIRSVRE